MKSAFRFTLQALLAVISMRVLADVTVRQNIVGPGTSDADAEFFIPSGNATNITITANAGFVISSIVTNRASVGRSDDKLGDFTGLDTATITIAPENDVVITATFVNENAWWLNPFVRNNVYVAPAGLYPDGCAIDADELYFIASEGYSSEPPGIHMYDVTELSNSIDSTLVPLKSENVEFVEGESGETVAVSSRLGAVFTNPTASESYAVRPTESDWELQENFESVQIGNLAEFELESLESFAGGAFGNDGFYVSDGERVYCLVPNIDTTRSVITNLHIGSSWNCPNINPWSLNVKTINGVDYIYGVFAGNDTVYPGNAMLIVLDTSTDNVTSNAFWTEEVENDEGLISSLYTCFSSVQITGISAGTPRIVMKDESYTYIFDLDSDYKTLVSQNSTVTFEGSTDQYNLYDSTVSNVGGIAVTDDESRMFNICCYDSATEEEDEEYVIVDVGEEGDDYGEEGDDYRIIRLKVFEKAPQQYEIRGIFEYGDGDVDAGHCTIAPEEGTNIVYSVPEGYIKSVTTNGVPVADFIPKTNAFEFASEAVNRHVCIKMSVVIGVAKIGNEEFPTVEDALLEAYEGDTVQLISDTSITTGCTIDKCVTIDTCGFTLTNNSVVTVDSLGSLIITNNDITASERSFVNNGRVIVCDGATLDVHAITLSSGPRSDLWKADLDDTGSYEVQSGGFMVLPDAFGWWCFNPADVELEPGNYCYSFFDGTEIGAVVSINRMENGIQYFTCTDLTLEYGGDAHSWSSLVASYGGEYYTDISDAIDDANGATVTLLANSAYLLDRWESVVIDTNGYTFNASVFSSCTLRITTDAGVTTYYSAKNIDSLDEFSYVISSVTYDGNQHTPFVTVTHGETPLINGTDFTVSNETFVNAGSHSVTITGIGKYASSTTKTFVINKATLTATAQNRTIKYGDTPSYEIAFSGFVNNETESVISVRPTATASYNPVDRSTWTQSSYVITPSGGTAGNYEFSYVNGTLTVNNRQLTGVSVVQNGEIEYDGAPHVASVIATPSTAFNETVSFTYCATENGQYAANVPAFTEAGTYTVYYIASANYHDPVNGTFEIAISTPASADPVPVTVGSVSFDSDGNFRVTVSSPTPGMWYTAFCAESLADPSSAWLAEQCIQAPTNGPVTLTVVLSDSPSKFVRVMETQTELTDVSLADFEE